MPSFAIHLAIANKYLQSHQNEDTRQFINGTLSVDLSKDKVASHHSIKYISNNVMTIISGKVDMASYLSSKQISTSFDRGEFLHLITDYEFYTKFLTKEDFESLDCLYDENKAREIMYNDYARINEHLKEKYNIIYPEEVKKYDISSSEQPKILDIQKLDKFIVQMANINLDSYEKSIKKCDIIKS